MDSESLELKARVEDVLRFVCCDVYGVKGFWVDWGVGFLGLGFRIYVLGFIGFIGFIGFKV